MKKFLAAALLTVTAFAPAYAAEQRFGAECFVSKITPTDPQGMASKINVWWSTDYEANTLNMWVFHTDAGGTLRNRFTQYTNTRVWLGDGSVNWNGWIGRNQMTGSLNFQTNMYIETLRQSDGRTVRIESKCHLNTNSEKFWQ